MTMAKDRPSLDEMDNGGQKFPSLILPSSNSFNPLPEPLISLPDNSPSLSPQSTSGHTFPLPAHSPTHNSTSVGRGGGGGGIVHSRDGRERGGSAQASMGLRLQYLERMCADLQREKKAMEEEFGRQRKKFMDQMVQSDTEQQLLKASVEKFSSEVQDLTTRLLQKDEVMQDQQAAVKLMEDSHREAFDADRVKYEEEIASLTRILNVQTTEHESQLQREREAFEREKAAIMAHLPPDLLPSPPQLSLSPPNPSPSPSRPPCPSLSLESSMRQAAQESKLLKSVVVPLEEEIDLLKLKLADTEERLQAYEGGARAPSSLIDLDGPVDAPLAPWQAERTNTLSPSPTDMNKQLQMHHQLDLERSARHDLEMHTKALEQQKAMLQEETLTLNKAVQMMECELKKERERCRDLKQTWELANQHFLVSQDSLNQRIYYLQQQLLLQLHGIEQGIEQGSEERGEEESEERRGGEGRGEERAEGASTSTREENTQGGPPGSWLTVRTHKRSFSSQNQELSSPGELASRRSRSWSELHVRGQRSENLVQVAALESELKRIRQLLDQRTQACGSYEAQLQRVQEQMIEELEEKERDLVRLRVENRKTMAGVMRERKAKEELRRMIAETRESFTLQVENVQKNTSSLSVKLKQLREQYTQGKHDAQRELAHLSDERAQLFGQVQSAEEEYDLLKVQQSEESQKYTERMAEARKAQEVVEGRMASLQTILQQMKQEKERSEENLGARAAIMQEQLLGERAEKERMESSLARQLESAKKQISAMQVLREQLQKEQAVKDEAIAARSLVEEKSRQFIADQHKKLEAEVAGRQASEQTVRDLQKQLSSLKTQLDTSQETQKDFVELSQSLQVKLAAIEEQQVCSTVSQPALPLPSHPTE